MFALIPRPHLLPDIWGLRSACDKTGRRMIGQVAVIAWPTEKILAPRPRPYRYGINPIHQTAAAGGARKFHAELLTCILRSGSWCREARGFSAPTFASSCWRGGNKFCAW